MKNYYSLVLIFLSISFYGQQFPTNFDSNSLALAKQNVELWNGKLVATQCEVLEVKTERKKRYYKCGFENNDFIWVNSLMNEKTYKAGDFLRILGYFAEVLSDDKIARKYNPNEYHLLVFATLNLTNQNAYHLSGTDIQFNQWRNGIIEQENE